MVPIMKRRFRFLGPSSILIFELIKATIQTFSQQPNKTNLIKLFYFSKTSNLKQNEMNTQRNRDCRENFNC